MPSDESAVGPDRWRSVMATEVQVGDIVRTAPGEVVIVTRIEQPFLGRADFLALVEDTEARWYKRPVRCDAMVEVIVHPS